MVLTDSNRIGDEALLSSCFVRKFIHGLLFRKILVVDFNGYSLKFPGFFSNLQINLNVIWYEILSD